MDKTRETLLQELGLHSSGRRIRSDLGKTRKQYAPRTDKGKARESYDKTGAAYNHKIFDRFIVSHSTSSGSGDNLTRDENMIFPPQITSYYKTIQPKDRPSYASSVKRRNHPEELRWNWLMAEVSENPAKWVSFVAAWYFITERDLLAGLWTYPEWAFSYMKVIGGHFNRKGPESLSLSYDIFAKGGYGIIKYDDEGHLVI